MTYTNTDLILGAIHVIDGTLALLRAELLGTPADEREEVTYLAIEKIKGVCALLDNLGIDANNLRDDSVKEAYDAEREAKVCG